MKNDENDENDENEANTTHSQHQHTKVCTLFVLCGHLGQHTITFFLFVDST